MTTELDHPCKVTCSGWQAGFDKGVEFCKITSDMDLEEWWATEPFGFDHPDTKNGIQILLDKKQSKISALEARLDDLENILKDLQSECGYASPWWIKIDTILNKNIERMKIRTINDI